MKVIYRWRTYDCIMNTNEASYDETLANFNSIDAGVYVDCISAKYSETAHVYVVQKPKVNRVHADQLP